MTICESVADDFSDPEAVSAVVEVTVADSVVDDPAVVTSSDFSDSVATEDFPDDGSSVALDDTFELVTSVQEETEGVLDSPDDCSGVAVVVEYAEVLLPEVDSVSVEAVSDISDEVILLSAVLLKVYFCS